MTFGATLGRCVRAMSGLCLNVSLVMGLVRWFGPDVAEGAFRRVLTGSVNCARVA